MWRDPEVPAVLDEVTPAISAKRGTLDLNVVVRLFDRDLAFGVTSGRTHTKIDEQAMPVLDEGVSHERQLRGLAVALRISLASGSAAILDNLDRRHTVSTESLQPARGLVVRVVSMLARLITNRSD